jgi:glycosyltransferase involved in cell wall biosynthesis
LVSFGLPVRNGGVEFHRTLDSLRAQDLADIEIVVSDNASTDNTRSIAESAAKTDSRIAYHRADRNYGQIENFNRAFQLSRGSYFRWIGCGDIVAPNYARRCAECMDANPKAVGVTTNFSFVSPNGNTRQADYQGPRLDQSSRLHRLQRFLWFADADPLYFDPIYSMLRRSSLESTPLLRIHRDPDLLLALELCLTGPFIHLNENLAQRMAPDLSNQAALAKRYHVSLITPKLRMARRYGAFAKVALARSETLPESLSSLALVFWNGARRVRHLKRRLRRAS